MKSFTTRQGRQSTALAIFLLVQTVAAVFFVGDSVGDLLSDGTGAHSMFEVLVAVALVLGIGFGLIGLRRTLITMRAQEQTIAAASGDLARVIDDQFGAWGLTPAERDVGFLALKGLDVAEIAKLREAAAGTVRAQLTHIYAKAGVSGRAQFAAFFVEDLLAAPLPAATQAGRLASIETRR